jgi:1,4-alpha-glucan branching enzyme
MIAAITTRKGIMKTLEHETSNTTGWHRHSLKPINFYCLAPQAKSVQITGDFNQWTPIAMRQRADGWWYLQAELNHGHHEYRFLVDGKPTLDPHSVGSGRNAANEAVSSIAVS